jgi:hypothetical protein
MSGNDYELFMMGMALGGLLGFSALALFVTRLKLWADR